ncbi:MAG: hypothetical protein A4S09_13830 [Proteobacteria bacterium SG_bin7]|nr:MAG: hypothetical protein A4S09_13830 [Proteobacteria bacterium SG_bin7]
MRALVTGANGFLGSKLTRRLVELGHETICFVRPASNLSNIATLNVDMAFGNVTNKTDVFNACKGIDVVFHLAAVIASDKRQMRELDVVNIGGTQNIVESVRDLGVKKLVHVSSVVAIGAETSQDRVLNEKSPYNNLLAANKNMASKKHGEEIVLAACRRKEVNAVIVNPSLIFGAGDAQKSTRTSNIRAANGKLKFFTEGGVNIVAVEDVVDGIVAAYERGRSGERYILGGENITIRELLTHIANCAGATPPKYKLPSSLLKIAARLTSRVTRENIIAATMYHWFDNSKARHELGFNPRPAREAIKNSVTWMKENGYVL